MPPSTPEMRKNLKPVFKSLEIIVKTKLVLILAKREDQALISIFTILKFSGQYELLKRILWEIKVLKYEADF